MRRLVGAAGGAALAVVAWIARSGRRPVGTPLMAALAMALAMTAYLVLGRGRRKESKPREESDLKVGEWYPGRWYEIASATGSVSKAVMWTTNNSVNFTLLPDGTMDLAASCYNQNVLFGARSRRFNAGTATFGTAKNTIVWNMSILNGLATVSFGVWIRYVDPTHQWLVLAPASNPDSAVYICSRTPHMAPGALKRALGIVKAMGYNLEELRPVSQQDPYEDITLLPTLRRYGAPSAGHGPAKDGQDVITPFIFRGGYGTEHAARLKAQFLRACVHGDLNFVYNFVQREPLWVDVRDKRQWGALHVAAFNGHLPLVRYLLSVGASPDARTANFETPLQLALRGYVRHLGERVRWLLDPHASVFDLNGTAARGAAAGGAAAGGAAAGGAAAGGADGACADYFSSRPHSLFCFERSIDQLLARGASVLHRDQDGRPAGEALEHAIGAHSVLHEWDVGLGLETEAEASERGRAVRDEVLASLKRVRSSLYYGAAMNAASPTFESWWLRLGFMIVVASGRLLAAAGAGLLSSVVAVAWGLKFALVAGAIWFPVRGAGKVYYNLLQRGSRAERDQAYRAFRAQCVLYIVLAMNNPTIHKIAQIISSRPDLVDREVALALQVLRENVPPMPTEELERELTEAFGADRAHLFASFDMVPIASGTIAQVHRARLAGSQTMVAVKVVRRSISEGLERVLRLVTLILSVRFFYNKALMDRTKRIYALILCQTDMTLEAASINAMQRACDASNNDRMRVPRLPRVYSLASTRNVLTMELIENHVACERFEETGVPGTVLAMRLGHFHLRSVFVDGLFHCDLHPGNIFLDPNDGARMTLVDFGLVGEIEEADRVNLTAFFLAALSGEYDVALSIFRQHFLENADEALHDPEAILRFNADMEPIFRHHYEESSEWDTSALVQDFERVFRRYKLHGSSLWASIELSLVTLQGTVHTFKTPNDVRQLFQQFITSHYGVLLRSIETSEHYNRLYRSVMDKYGWGAILFSANEGRSATPSDRKRAMLAGA